jgi:hypothetical protein
VGLLCEIAVNAALLLKCDTAIIYPAYWINTNLFICNFYILYKNLYGIYISGFVAQPQISICEITASWLATFEVAALSWQCPAVWLFGYPIASIIRIRILTIELRAPPRPPISLPCLSGSLPIT